MLASLMPAALPPEWVLILAGELFVTVFLVAYSFGIDSHPVLTPVPTFLEGDLTLAQPYVKEAVSTGALVGVSFVLPLLLIALVQGGAGWRKADEWRKVATSVFFALLGLIQSLILAQAIYHTLKLSFGRPRPNFFAYCNYAGYRDALAGAINMTDYTAAITPGALGDLSKCWASTANVRSSVSSFPSGHAGTAFSGLLFLTLYLRSAVGMRAGTHFTLAALFVTSWPLIVAAYIGVSRFRDHFHFTDDIAAGAMIGIGSALVAWWHYQAAERDTFEVARKAAAAAEAGVGGAGGSAAPAAAGMPPGGPSAASSIPEPRGAAYTRSAIPTDVGARAPGGGPGYGYGHGGPGGPGPYSGGGRGGPGGGGPGGGRGMDYGPGPGYGPGGGGGPGGPGFTGAGPMSPGYGPRDGGSPRAGVPYRLPSSRPGMV